MNALSYEQGIDDGIRMATLKEKRKLKAYRKAVKTHTERGYKIRSMNENDWVYKTKAYMKSINAEYRRILKETK